MRVAVTPTTHTQFLQLCTKENRIPNQVLGRWIDRAVKRGRIGNG